MSRFRLRKVYGKSWKRNNRQALKILILLSSSIAAGLLRKGAPRLCIAKALCFVRQYAFSYDFFKKQNIKVMVEKDYSDPYLAADEIALRNTGGVSISYQQSTLPFPQVPYGLCADVAFLFAPCYADVIKKSGSDNEAVVFTGFLTDSSFKATKPAASKLRSGMVDNGADFIVAYFDEQSGSGRMSFITDEHNEYVYSRLLEWVLRNDSVGVILSPKSPDTLFDRISGIGKLIEKAKATGRCIFMNGQSRTFSWPAEASQAADITIGSLGGGTIVLGAMLAGQKAAYFDPIGLYSWPEYSIGRDVKVFDDIDKLIGMLDKYRYQSGGEKNVFKKKAFLDLAESKSMFVDGESDIRMARYIKWLLDSFDLGQARESAIDNANRQYKALWSEKSVLLKKQLT